jgi:hypothetical protein
MISFLLNLLDSPMKKIENPGSVKAQIVEAIKSMLNSITHLTQVSFRYQRLNKSGIYVNNIFENSY